MITRIFCGKLLSATSNSSSIVTLLILYSWSGRPFEPTSPSWLCLKVKYSRPSNHEQYHVVETVNLKEDSTPPNDSHAPLAYTFTITLLEWPKKAPLQTSIFIHGLCSNWLPPCYKPFPYSLYWCKSFSHYSPHLDCFILCKTVNCIKQPENYSKVQKFQNSIQL